MNFRENSIIGRLDGYENNLVQLKVRCVRCVRCMAFFISIIKSLDFLCIPLGKKHEYAVKKSIIDEQYKFLWIISKKLGETSL